MRVQHRYKHIPWEGWVSFYYFGRSDTQEGNIKDRHTLLGVIRSPLNKDVVSKV